MQRHAKAPLRSCCWRFHRAIHRCLWNIWDCYSKAESWDWVGSLWICGICWDKIRGSVDHDDDDDGGGGGDGDYPWWHSCWQWSRSQCWPFHLSREVQRLYLVIHLRNFPSDCCDHCEHAFMQLTPMLLTHQHWKLNAHLQCPSIWWTSRWCSSALSWRLWITTDPN